MRAVLGWRIAALAMALIVTVLPVVAGGDAVLAQGDDGALVGEEGTDPALVGGALPVVDDVGTEELSPAEELPSPGVYEVPVVTDLARLGTFAAGQSPVAGVAQGRDDRLDSSSLVVEVPAHDVTEKVGGRGFVFSVGLSGSSSGDAGLPAMDLAVDVSSLSGRFGAGFEDRLVVRRVAECELAEPVAENCRAGELVPTRRDGDLLMVEGVAVPSVAAPGASQEAEGDESSSSTTSTPSSSTTTTSPASTSTTSTGASSTTTTGSTSSTTTVPVSSTTTGVTSTTTAPPTESSEAAPSTTEENADATAEPDGADAGLSSSGEMLMVSSSVDGGPSGSYAATPLDSSASWQVGPGSGEFSWSYPMPMFPAPAGETPQLALSYSSGSVDGMVGGENNQAGQAGLGWSLTEAYVERRYWSCPSDGPWEITDLCWHSNNATLVLNGQASELVHVSGNEWRLKDDPNWRVVHGTGESNGDDNGEYWTVFTPDGTRYEFGRGASWIQHSTWTVPVFGDDAGEPACTYHRSDLSWCRQAWRWNLDRVVDPHDNMASYYYGVETNKYGMGGYPQDVTEYDRGGYLDHIDYGRREGVAGGAYARVQVETRYRCNTLSTSCPAPTVSNGSSFPDVPNDLICSGTWCDVHSPSFFSGVRYRRLSFQARPAGGSMTEVDAVRFAHEFVPGGQGQVLWLRWIDRAGKRPGPQVALPAVRIESNGTYLPNRVDGSDPLSQHRVAQITDHYGARIDVTYGQPTPCSGPYPPDPGAETWDVNEEDCFPKFWTPEDGGEPGFGIFEKYVATRVTVTDQVSGAARLVTDYVYEGTPMWAHAHPPGSTASTQTWNEWRGYAGVRVVEGDGASRSATQLRVFRGMHGDKLVGGTTRNVIVSVPGSTESYTDQPWLAGRIFSERSLDVLADGTVSGSALRGTVTEYTGQVTAGSGTEAARFVAPAEVRKRWPSSEGTRYQTTTTTYNNDLMVAMVADTGWEHRGGDQRCVRTTWSSNTSTWMLEYPKVRVVRPNTDCSPGEDMFNERWYYDGQSTQAPVPGSGNVTRHERVQGTGGGTWAAETFSYDPLGRQTSSTDAVNATTSTSYTPTIGFPSQVTVTNDLGHQTTTTMNSVRPDLPATTTDANGNQTSLQYDALGRTTSVRLPGDGSGTPSHAFTYVIDPDKNSPHGVTTETKTATGTRSSTVIYDAMLRERQTHSDSPVAGRVIVKSLTRDNRGLVSDSTLPYPADAAPYTVIAWPSGVDRDRTTLDEFGRPVAVDRIENRTSTVYTTTTNYTLDTTTVTPPIGAPTTTQTDGLGRTIAVIEHQNPSADSTTTYGYVGATELISQIKPGTNSAFATNMTYDRGGRLIERDDPNTGISTTKYDKADRAIATTAADGDTIFAWYDSLGRPTATADAQGQTNRPTTPPSGHSGGLLTERSYDTAPNGIGQPATAVRHHPVGRVESAVNAYDNRGRPIQRTITVDGTGQGPSGTDAYTYNHTYTPDGQVATMAVSATGDLPAETVTVDFDDLGHPSRLTSDRAGTIVDGTSRTARDQLSARFYGNHGFVSGSAEANRASQYVTWDDDTGRLSRIATWTPGSNLVHRADYTWDHAGNLTAIATEADNVTEDRQCFDYDARNRLAHAYTTTHGNQACTYTPGGSGAWPYDEAYTFDRHHRMTTATIDDTTTETYSFSGAGPISAPNSYAGTTYTWNPDGTLSSESGATTAAYTWTTDGLLASLDRDGTSQTYRYGPDGSRTVRTDGDTFTVYLPGQEVTVSTQGATTRRTYTLGGTTVAIGDANTLVFQTNDHQGTPVAWIDRGTSNASVRRQTPYGDPRGPEPTAPNDHGFLDKPVDATGLSQLEARYYNGPPRHFTAPDPIVEPHNPASLNRYAYSRNSPTTHSDPTGLRPCANQCLDNSEAQQAFDEWYLNRVRDSRARASAADQKGCIQEVCLTGSELWDAFTSLVSGDAGPLPDPGRLPDGVCVQGQVNATAIVGPVGGLSGCVVRFGLGFQLVGTQEVGVSVGLPNASATVGAGAIFTNASDPNDLRGPSICGGGSGAIEAGGSAGVGGTVCFSIVVGEGGSWHPTGYITVAPELNVGAGVSATLIEGTGWATLSYTGVTSATDALGIVLDVSASAQESLLERLPNPFQEMNNYFRRGLGG